MNWVEIVDAESRLLPWALRHHRFHGEEYQKDREQPRHYEEENQLTHLLSVPYGPASY
jgi:hypothetical protein